MSELHTRNDQEEDPIVRKSMLDEALKKQDKKMEENMRIIEASFQQMQNTMTAGFNRLDARTDEQNKRMDKMASQIDASIHIATTALQEGRMHANGFSAHNRIIQRVERLENHVFKADSNSTTT